MDRSLFEAAITSLRRSTHEYIDKCVGSHTTHVVHLPMFAVLLLEPLFVDGRCGQLQVLVPGFVSEYGGFERRHPPRERIKPGLEDGLASIGHSRRDLGNLGYVVVECDSSVVEAHDVGARRAQGFRCRDVFRIRLAPAQHEHETNRREPRALRCSAVPHGQSV